jgi:hypothetical protein
MIASTKKRKGTTSRFFGRDRSPVLVSEDPEPVNFYRGRSAEMCAVISPAIAVLGKVTLLGELKKYRFHHRQRKNKSPGDTFT